MQEDRTLEGVDRTLEGVDSVVDIKGMAGIERKDGANCRFEHGVKNISICHDVCDLISSSPS